MSGFTSIGDPAVDKDFAVTGNNVLDPLYPHGDDVWGPSPLPNALLTPDELGLQFEARDAPQLGTGVSSCLRHAHADGGGSRRLTGPWRPNPL